MFMAKMPRVMEWVRKVNEGRNNVHHKPQSGLPSVVTGGHILRGGDTETGAPL